MCVQLARGLYKPQNRLGYHISLSDHDGSQGYQCSCVSGCVFLPVSGCARSRSQLRRSGSNSVSFNTMSMPCVCLLFAACKAVVDELKYAIKHTDQKKTIDIGSQRIRSDGSVDGKRAVQWAGSEVHVMELLEKIW